jgi:hypothetical protein
VIVHPASIKLEPKQSLFIIPLGDIQSEGEYDRLAKLVEWCGEREREGNIVRLFGTGDYFETFSPSERAALRHGKSGYGLHETTQEKIDATVQAQADGVYEVLAPMTDHFFGLLRGHHKHDWFIPKGLERGMSTDQYLCQKLNCEYLGSVGVIRVLINGLPFVIFASHGYGNARTKGARLNKRLRMRDVYLDANWYVMGHDNEKMVDVDEPMFTDTQGDVYYKKQYFTGVGSFQKSYEVGKADGGYVEDALYPPCSLGVVICQLRVAVNKQGKPRLDYHVSA